MICKARIWNNGKGSRCNIKVVNTIFCGTHNKIINKQCVYCNKIHKYRWEHLGRWDEPPSSLFTNKQCWNMSMSNIDKWFERANVENIEIYFPNWRENLYYISKKNNNEIKNAIINLNKMKKNIGIHYFIDYLNSRL